MKRLLLIVLPILGCCSGALANSNPYNFYNNLFGPAVSVAAQCSQDGCTVSPSTLILPQQTANHVTVTSNITNLNPFGSLSFQAYFTVTEDDAGVEVCKVTVPITVPALSSTAQFGPPSLKINAAQDSWSCYDSAGVIHVVATGNATAKGQTQVELSQEFAATLETLGVALAALSPAKLKLAKGKGIAHFPIIRGDFDLDEFEGEFDHIGGLSLTADGVTVGLASFRVELTPTNPRMTGLVVAEGTLVGPLPLFKLDLSNASIEAKRHKLNLVNVGVSLTEEAADELNRAFNTTAFRADLTIGIVDIDAHGLQRLK